MGGPLEQFAFNPKTGKFDPSATAVSGHTFGCTGCVDGQGSNFTISAKGAESGIVWAIDYTGFGTDPAVLYAFDAANVANELYDSTQAGIRDRAAVAVKFTAPTVANGNVYIGGRNTVTVYGLLSPHPAVTTASKLPAPNANGSVTVRLNSADKKPEGTGVK